THAVGSRAEGICRKLGFDGSFRVDAHGHSGVCGFFGGRLWVRWRSVIRRHSMFMRSLTRGGGDKFHLIVVYAAPSASRRSGLWGELKTLVHSFSEPVFLGGDFNSIVRLDERTGGNGLLSSDSLEFGRWINDLALIDMGFKGGQFTWKRGRTTDNFIAKRLDRVLCDASARLKWHEAVVTHLPFLSSDHLPLYLQLCPAQRGDPLRRPFRFEAAWLHHQAFKELLSVSWKPDVSTPTTLDWNREVFGVIQERKANLLHDIQYVQGLIGVDATNDLLIQEEILLKELDVSREKWIVLGDRNTAFFHTSTVIRRRRNRIEMLRDDDGRWVSDASALESMVTQYYQRLYSMDDVTLELSALPSGGFVDLNPSECDRLNKPFSSAEIEAAVRSMGRYKAPGPDGFQPVFYQHCWDVVGPSVVRFVFEFFETGCLPRSTNDALIVLIGKVSKPERISQFRPISLCNVLFRTITKVMVIRLKEVISKLIGPTQSSFIPGRLSTDNIVMVQEAVQSMRRRKGRKGWMLLKLDLEKAYDRIRWDFLEDMLKAIGLSEVWVR
ncbi:hypothetical protein V2J09_021512, partial [Rumex salicifolius]